MADYNRRSRTITEGVQRSPNRAMLRAVGFTDADFVRNEEAGAVRAEQPNQRLELEWDEFDAGGVKRVQIVGEGMREPGGGKARVEFFR